MSAAGKTVEKSFTGRPAFFRWLEDTGQFVLALLGVWFLVTGFAEALVRALPSLGSVLNFVDLSTFNRWSFVVFVIGGVLAVAIQHGVKRIPH